MARADVIAAASLDLSALVALWDRLAADTVLGGIGSELERVTEYVASQAPAVVPRPSSGTSRVVGDGGIDFEGLNQCEASGENGWRTGRYGLETGTGDVGSWSLEAQQAKVREIYAQYGANAWGVNCRRFFGG